MNYELVGKRIKSLLRERGVTQNEIMQDTGIIRSTISAMINGKRKNDKLVDYCVKKFGISREELVANDDLLAAKTELNYLLERQKQLYQETIITNRKIANLMEKLNGEI